VRRRQMCLNPSHAKKNKSFVNFVNRGCRKLLLIKLLMENLHSRGILPWFSGTALHV
jgi:hypothetical protein